MGIGSFLVLWKPFSAPFVLWRGFFSLSFQSFVLSHLVFAPVRMMAVVYVSVKLPNYLSPKLTLTLTSHLRQNVGLGDGLVGSFPETYNNNNVCLKSLFGLIVS